uniref:Coagulation factor IX n=1 Tax=Mastacembelus armatus TaxID=205130 RepID=A0A7N8XVT9_9TELE
MAGVCLLALMAGLLLEVYGLAAEITQKNTGAVFVSPQAAHMMLVRQRRYNSGHLEEMLQKDNLERECKEEKCDMEEAREVFENDEKTMEFWVSYSDGDQCKPPPCQNDGVCKDGIGTYVCWCKPNFSGKNCEIEVPKQCLVNNGECSHFCVMQSQQPICQCATGYRLGSDKRSCEPTGPFSCGRVNLTSTSGTRSIINPRSHNMTDDTAQEAFYDDNTTQLYDYYDLTMNDPDLVKASVASAADIRDPETPAEKKQLHPWAFFPTLPTITAEENTEKRIVGGDEALPGEIPWQVTLMAYSQAHGRVMPFCGGSLLSELWVITAAHCLIQEDNVPKQGFFVRVGEHDVDQDEGPERDHLVELQHIHHKYDYKKSPYNHDIALLKLANPVELSNQRRPICLGPKDFIEKIMTESGGLSLVSGWGALKYLGLKATKLQKLAVPFVDRTACKQSSRDHITRFMFCAGFHSEQKDACQGDSGGPHATNYKGTWFLTGIVSWGEECAKDGRYGIYTRISQYYPWISQTTGLRVSN